jgi:ceramide glucosyltransferase
VLAIHHVLAFLGFSGLVLAAAYAVLVLVAVWIWARPRAASPALHLPPVTILKPLCGYEPGLYDNLRSFCVQDYPHFQVVFGVRDASDAALVIARRLLAEFPQVPMDIVVDARQHGSNHKVSNLINMLSSARHQFLVMADSDACVRPDYLRAVTGPLSDPSVGLVTCVYRGLPTPLIFSRLGSMFINEWYIPCVLLSRLLGHQGYVSGQTIALRSATLDAIGGLRAVANYLADDNRLGALIRQLGLRVVLSRYVPSAEHHEPSLNCLAEHETRWMCTLRVLEPLSFRFLFLTFSVPLATLGLALAAPDGGLSSAAWLLFGLTLMARVTLHVLQASCRERSRLTDLWLLPARDLLTCWIWLRSSFTSRIKWRNSNFCVSPDGLMRRLP